MKSRSAYYFKRKKLGYYFFVNGRPFPVDKIKWEPYRGEASFTNTISWPNNDNVYAAPNMLSGDHKPKLYKP